MPKISCFNCNAVMEFAERVGRKDECDSCRADLHVCKNCEHYEPTAYNECREPSADRIVEKESSNFCDFFSPSESGKVGSSKDDLMSAAEALFKKG